MNHRVGEGRNQGVGNADIILNGETLERVAKFKFLDVDIEAGKSMEAEMSHKVEKGAKALGH